MTPKETTIKFAFQMIAEEIGKETLIKLFQETYPGVSNHLLLPGEVSVSDAMLVINRCKDVSGIITEIADTFEVDFANYLDSNDYILKDEILDFVCLDISGDGDNEGTIAIVVK